MSSPQMMTMLGCFAVVCACAGVLPPASQKLEMAIAPNVTFRTFAPKSIHTLLIHQFCSVFGYLDRSRFITDSSNRQKRAFGIGDTNCSGKTRTKSDVRRSCADILRDVCETKCHDGLQTEVSKLRRHPVRWDKGKSRGLSD